MPAYVGGTWGLLLDGWEGLSIWGFDAGTGSFFAQLTRNGNTDENGPDVWITPGRYPTITNPSELANLIARATGATAAAVAAAMNHAVEHQGAPAHYRVPA